MVQSTSQRDAPAGVYRLLFEASPHPMLLVDVASLRVLRANAAAAAMYAYRQEDLLHLPLQELWPQAREVLARRHAGEPVPDQVWRHIRRQGETLDVSIAIHDASLGSGPALAFHVDEVSERAFSNALSGAQGRLLELIARRNPLGGVLEELVHVMEQLCDGMVGSVLLLDADGRHARHAAAPTLPAAYWRAIDGLEIGPAAGSCGRAMHLRSQVIATDIAADPSWEQYRAHALAQGLRACWSTPIYSSDGQVLGAFAMYYREVRSPRARELQVAQTAVHLAAIAIERDRAERALRERESRLHAILDHAFAVVWLKDPDGRYTYVNRRFEQLTGIAAALAIGRDDRQLFPRALAQTHSANDEKVLQVREPVQFEHELLMPRGSRAHLTVKFPLLGPDLVPYAICGVSTDITERKRAEQALERSREELRTLSARLLNVREEERQRISREIHDELGQTLTALRMNMSLLIGAVREAAVPDAASIAAQLESMQGLVSAVLGSVKRIATELRPEALDTLGLQAALEWQAEQFRRRTGIACHVSAPGGALQVDGERATALFRIFQEALTNAARHSGARLVQVQVSRDGAFLEMSVMDDGEGITEAAMRSSTSLGLLGMRERAAMLGGTLSVAGRPGEGTTVTVRLPAG